MTATAITTIQQLLNELATYSKNLPIVMLDDNQGYVSVAFKKETAQKGEQLAQWLTFYPHPEKSVYPIETLFDYLKRLPTKATICTQESNGTYSPLFLGIDTMENEGDPFQWVVITDRLTYEETFLDLQTSDQHQALEKMLAELKKEHSEALDTIHNWLCQQNNPLLFQGILKEDRTLEGAMNYCLNKAKEQAENATCAMIGDKTVFSWVTEYFLLDKVEVPKVNGTVTISQPKSKTVTHKKESEGNGQVSLFELA